MACQQAEKSISIELLFNNDGLDELERTVERYEMIRLASIFGGTSIYGGILWGEADSLVCFSGSQICSGTYKGHDARMIVPSPSEDSMAKEPRDSSTRSLMLESPNPRLVLS